VVVRTRAERRRAFPRSVRPSRQNAPAPLVTEIRRHSPVGRFQAARCQEQSHAVELTGNNELDAYTADRRLTCDRIDLDQLTTFTDRHFSKPIPYTPHGKRSG
jgi:hypothetical protein